MLPYRPDLKKNSRRLRCSMTDAEQKLWQSLRNRQLGVNFNRQKPIGSYIVDFYCAAAKLVVEIDGGQHFESAGIEKDQRRSHDLAALGLKVLGFDNLQVLKELDEVLIRIFQETQAGIQKPAAATPQSQARRPK